MANYPLRQHELAPLPLRLQIVGWRIGLACLLALRFPCVSADEASRSHRQQPFRIVSIAAGPAPLVVGLHNTGELAGITTDLQWTGHHWQVADHLAELVATPDRRYLVASDDGSHRLVVLRLSDGAFETMAQASVPTAPEHLCFANNERHLLATSRWTQQLTRWSLDWRADRPRLECEAALDLPFCPGVILTTDDPLKVIVADANGPYLALCELAPLRLCHIVEIPGHNLHALSWSSDGHELLLAHVMLHDFIPTTRDHVFWGNIVAGMLRTIPRDALLLPTTIPPPAPQIPKIHGSLFPLGHEGHAAGDPERLVVTQQGDVVIALAGTHELVIRHRDERVLHRIPVGRGPCDLWLDPEAARAIVVNRYDDSLSLVNLQTHHVERTLALANGDTQISLAEEGEAIFHDATQSLDGWFSCHSCHTDGHTCGLRNDNFGDNHAGAPKLIPSLLGTGSSGPWAWNGSQHHLDQQIEKSLRLTLRTGDRREHPEIAGHTVAALAAYLQTLPAPPSRDAARGLASDPRVAKGQRHFLALACNHCHEAPTYTSDSIYAVGIQDERGTDEFNPPSLCGISQRFRWLHDGRAKSLRDVLKTHPTPAAVTRLNDDELQELQIFLESL